VRSNITGTESVPPPPQRQGTPGTGRRLPLQEFGVAGLFFLAAFAATGSARVPGSSALIWPANALAAALLVRMPQVRWLPALATILVAGVLATSLATHDALGWSLAIGAINLLEVGAKVWTVRGWLRYPLPELSVDQGLRVAAVVGVAIPILTAIPGGWILHMRFGAPEWAATINWWRAGAIGGCLCAPMIYLYSERAARRLIASPYIIANLLLLVLSLSTTYLAVRFLRFPFVVIGVPLIVAAFNAGSFGTALMSSLTGILVITLWKLGMQPGGVALVPQGAGLPGLPLLALVATVLPPVAVGLATDQRRRAELALADERERLRTTLHAIADAVITTDMDGRITYVNAAASDLLGQALEDVEGRKLYDVVAMTDPGTSRSSHRLLGTCLALGEVVRRQEAMVLHRPDGDVRYVSKVVSPVFGENKRVTGAVVVLRDATAEYERDRKLHHLASHDVLTGLCNRFELERRLQLLFEHANALILPATLLVVDLDHFKAVNDGGGHAAGDAMLRRVAETLKAAVRSRDTVARVGGDEFAVVLEKATPERARAVASQILRALNPLQIEVDGRIYTVGASVGAAMITDGYDSIGAWMAAADSACYEAKRMQRGQLVFAQPSGATARARQA
jgi:diguanylate cyclase (GGDEF)-like protein/PAS domain S-box-containing protein